MSWVGTSSKRSKMRNLFKTVLCCCFTFGIILFSSGDLSAQVVSPSLDPTENVIMPAASGWRRVASAGVEYLEGDGSRKNDISSIYDLNSSGLAGNIAFNLGNFYFEGSYNSTTINTTPDPSDDSVNLETTDSRVSFVLFGDDFVSIGLGGHSRTTEDFIPTFAGHLTSDRSGMIGSISVAMGESFKIGGAVERIKETSSHKVDNNWVDTTFGLSAEFGSTSGILIRMEASSTSSAKSNKVASGGLFKNNHPEVAITRGNLDIMFSGLLFAFENITKSYSVESSDFSATENQMGVLWVPPDGLILGFYFINQSKEKTAPNTSAEYTQANSAFSIKLGQVF